VKIELDMNVRSNTLDISLTFWKPILNRCK